MNIKSINNTINFSEAAAADKKSRANAGAENEPVYKLNRFDRYEGVTADNGTIPLNGESQRKRGIFSENTSAEVGEKILRSNDAFKGYDKEGFSAKHIVSVFFDAEAENPFDINAFFAKVDQMRFNVTGIEASSDKSTPATDNQ